GHPTRDPAPVSQLAAGRAAGSGREPGAPADARAGRVGHAGPVHARALWGGIRGRARTGRADGTPRRGPLAVAGSPRRDRPGGGVPERRLAVSTLTRQPAHGREGWAEPAARGSAPRWMPPAWAITAACGLLYVIAAPPSRDLAAASYRSDLFAHAGFTLWDNAWYGGHHLLAYSVLAPARGALLGPQLLAALSMTAATALFTALIAGRFPARATSIAA